MEREVDCSPASKLPAQLTDRTVYVSGRGTRGYKLGDEVSFARGGNGLLYEKLLTSPGNAGGIVQHRQNGWSFPEGEGTWIEGKDAMLAMEIKERPSRLMLQLDAYSIDYPADESQEMTVLVNGVAVGLVAFQRLKWQKARFTFDSRLIGPDNIAHINIRAKYATRPLPDKRILSFYCRSLTVDSVAAAETYTMGQDLFLGASGQTACLGYGWSMPEDDGVWIEGREAAVDLNIADKVGNCNLAIKAKSIDLGGREQAVKIYLNESMIGEAKLSTETTEVNIQFPGSLVKSGQTKRIKIHAEHSNTCAPDPRILSVFCKSIAIQNRQ
jgi:hypothetical protein